jgi:nitrate/nitrite transporter NarK
LIIAAEAIFALPYHVGRFFRPSLLAVLGLDNTELGLLQSAYGVVAMLAYFPGGPLADLFPARKLITASLLSTAVGGFYFATLPGFDGLWLLFAFWGLTTILLFWAALIRATREWGDATRQGRAYGLLDAGRGLLAAVLAAVAVALFAGFFPADPEAISPQARREAIQYVILFYTGITFLAALLTWFFVSEPEVSLQAPERARLDMARLRVVFAMPTVWLQAVVVICAYVGYRGLDYYSLFAVDVYGLSEVEGAEISASLVWIRPVAALAAGLLGDRIRASRAAALGFLLLGSAYLLSAGADYQDPAIWIFLVNAVVCSAAVFGLRGIYFALLQEGSVPAASTGTAVGIVSVLGYSPDVFFSVLAGWLLDTYPGAEGYRLFCLLMVAFAALGFAASVRFSRTTSPSSPT